LILSIGKQERKDLKLASSGQNERALKEKGQKGGKNKPS
jgi:hypothetical protein